MSPIELVFRVFPGTDAPSLSDLNPKTVHPPNTHTLNLWKLVNAVNFIILSRLADLNCNGIREVCSIRGTECNETAEQGLNSVFNDFEV